MAIQYFYQNQNDSILETIKYAIVFTIKYHEKETIQTLPTKLKGIEKFHIVIKIKMI